MNKFENTKHDLKPKSIKIDLTRKCERLTKTTIFYKKIKKYRKNPNKIAQLLKSTPKTDLNRFLQARTFKLFAKLIIEDYPITLAQIFKKQNKALIITPKNKSCLDELINTSYDFIQYYTKFEKLNFNLLLKPTNKIPLLQKEAENIEISAVILKLPIYFIDGIIADPTLIKCVPTERLQDMGNHNCAHLLQKQPQLVEYIPKAFWEKASNNYLRDILKEQPCLFKYITPKIWISLCSWDLKNILQKQPQLAEKITTKQWEDFSTASITDVLKIHPKLFKYITPVKWETFTERNITELLIAQPSFAPQITKNLWKKLQPYSRHEIMLEQPKLKPFLKQN